MERKPGRTYRNGFKLDRVKMKESVQREDGKIIHGLRYLAYEDRFNMFICVSK